MHIYRNFINGEWVNGSSNELMDNINPATGEVLGQSSLANVEDTRRAISAAQNALPQWKKVPAPKRARIILKAMLLMQERKEDLAKMLTLEEGKLLNESLGEVQKTINILEFMAGTGTRLSGITRQSELPNTFCYTIKEPLGVVGLITAWNFPVSIPTWKIAPALIAGNTIVLKPSEYTPGVSEMIVQLFTDAGVPPGVLNLVLGKADVGKEIGQNSTVKGISFTGSNPVGMALYQAGAQRGIPVQCEMGGKNPLIVMEDADIDLAAEAAMFGAFVSTGQRCTATSRVVVMENVADQLVNKVLHMMESFPAGNGLNKDSKMGPCVNQNQLNNIMKYIKIGQEEDQATLVKGGKHLTDGDYSKGYFVEPTLFDHVKPDMRIAQEEIFGPVLSVIRVKTFEEAIEAANNVRYGLSSSIYTNDNALVFKYIDQIETGITHVNSPTVGGEAHLPFGGMKDTGIGGREMNEEALEFFTELKTVYIDYTGAKREGNIY